jgi:predicted Zn-dependent protease
MDSKLLVALLLGLVSFFAHAEEYTASFDLGYRPALSSDEGGFWYQVDKLEESIKVSPERVTDPVLNNYVKNITCKLAGEYCPHIRVYILRNPHFNAGMYPNGMMHVWSGLLLRTTSEAELAAVLAHEIAHFLRSHQITQWRKLRANASAAIFADLFLTMGFATLGVVQGAMSFSRTQETEADLFGLQLMAKAGYTPETASQLWEYVYSETKSDKSKEKESVFFASHPKSNERMAVLAKKAQELRAAGRQYDSKQTEYLANVGPLY